MNVKAVQAGLDAVKLRGKDETVAGFTDRDGARRLVAVKQFHPDNEIFGGIFISVAVSVSMSVCLRAGGGKCENNKCFSRPIFLGLS